MFYLQKQLENLVEKLVMNHPELRDEIADLMPTPDLNPLGKGSLELLTYVYKYFL